MTVIRVTGSQLHAARVLVGLSREDLAGRASLCRHSIRKWETSSHAIPGAMYSHLCRVVDALEGEGARFSGDRVYLERRLPSDSRAAPTMRALGENDGAAA
jgi:transcriptional regulator with XRE-family HTH domain